MNAEWIVSPLVGALIGYITNDIAIKMLFRPANAVYIGRFRLPFTPGLIPKEKARLAQSIGNAVGDDLLDKETLAKALSSDEMLHKIRMGILDALLRGRENTDALGDILSNVLGADESGKIVDGARANVSAYLSKKLIEADIGSTAANSISASIKNKTPDSLTDTFSKWFGGNIKESMIRPLRQAINGYIERHASEVLTTTIDDESERLLSMRVCDLVKDHEDDLPAIADSLTQYYKKLIDSGLESALRTLDIASVVRQRIEGIDNMELEGMIFNVVDKELKAIVYLGALLGFVMGFVTLIKF